MAEVKKRKTLKLSHPNPLFEKWLEELKNEAAAKKSETQYAFAKALTSLRKYPLLLHTGKECMVLEHFGTKICLLLDRKLAEYKKNQVHEGGQEEPKDVNKEINLNHKKTPEKPKHRYYLDNHIARSDENKEHKNKSKRKSTTPKKHSKIYIPTMRSSPYAVLVALYKQLKETTSTGEMTKEELQTAAQPLCDTSMWKSLPGTYYTGWSCVGQLISRGLVQRRGTPHRFSLTESGIELAEKLPVINLDANEEQGSLLPSSSVSTNIQTYVENSFKTRNSPNNEENVQVLNLPELDEHLTVENNSQSQSSTTTSSTYEQVVLLQGQFEVILLIDTQEIHRGDELVKAVGSLEVNLQVRKLKVGDFAWVAKNAGGQELILPYIIERKRLDDLASSIKDGRFHEQKFRLKQCGVPHCMYLVEGHDQRRVGLPLPTLLQAAVNTQFVDKFTVKHTSNFHETVNFLANFTKAITRKFSNKTLLGCQKHVLPEFNIHDDCVSLMTFGEFNKLSSKTRKYCVKEMFIKHLVQLRGLSVEKAVAIVEKYPTPRSLAVAFQNEENDRFISEITVGHLKRKIGPALSKAICDLYTKPVLA